MLSQECGSRLYSKDLSVQKAKKCIFKKYIFFNVHFLGLDHQRAFPKPQPQHLKLEIHNSKFCGGGGPGYTTFLTMTISHGTKTRFIEEK